MVGCMRSTAIEVVKAEEEEDIKNQPLSDPKKVNDLCIPELDDFSSSFSDSFLDLESLNGWFMEGNAANMADLPVDFDFLRGELGDIKKDFEVFGDEICQKNETGEDLGGRVESLWGGDQEEGEIGDVGRSAEIGSDVTNAEGVVGGVGGEKSLGDLGCLIEEQLGKVNLDGQSNSLVPVFASENCENSGDGSKSVKTADGSCDSAKSDGVDSVAAGNVVEVSGNEIKVDQTVGDGDESGSGEESEDESSDSSSSSSSSSSSEEEEDEDSEEMSGQKKGKNKKGKHKKSKNEKGSGVEQTEIEDGEIMLSDAEEMVSWSDVEDDEGGGGGGPIKSKNELTVLPAVPTVNVTLEPHHETIPVGTILSVVGPKVIVEGAEKHNPLSESSILWVTESRSPLGIIDEIFGPVKNPYYIVRYNSENEVPSGIQQGTLISFVADFADHVLNDKSLYQKGYDASNENDEELSDEVEFSDDEKEAEYKRKQKIKKRGTSEYKPGNKRKDKRQLKNQKGNWNNNGDPAAQTPRAPRVGSNLTAVTEEHHFAPPFGASLNQDNHPCSSGPRQGFAGDQAGIPSFPHRPPGFPAPNGNWNNVIPQPQQQNANLLSGLPPNGMLWMQQSLPYMYPTHLQTGAAFQQQMGMVPGLPPNFNAMAVQPNFGGMLPPWPMNQNLSNPSQFGMDLQSQQGSLPLSGAGDQGVQSQGSQDSRNMQPPPPAFSFNGGRGGRGGRRGNQNHRGRGRFSGGRGRH